ncbi:MAG: phosphoribosylformylglycinamidine synthase subunit PurQ [Phycisphaeraceae bacterium]|nr:phosphoribosylformylglycinamidine synthase subunit PurQ [Phycisphaeraceae bacterium]
MPSSPRALVIRAAGTNCDSEMVRAFELAGARVDLVHLDRLTAEPQRLDDFDLFGFPGGFSYGDDIASGRLFAVRLRERLYPALRAAAERHAPMIGACNGFQVLVQVGLLPGPMPPASTWPEAPPVQTCALAHNVLPAGGSGFVDRWVRVDPNPKSPCIWTRPLVDAFRADPARAERLLRLPIAHGEGRFVTHSPAELDAIESNHQVALRYASWEGGTDNPNGSSGSAGGVAGICDASGRIFGLMPHPERYLDWNRHPFWTRLEESDRRGDTPGLMMFRAAVETVAPARV